MIRCTYGFSIEDSAPPIGKFPPNYFYMQRYSIEPASVHGLPTWGIIDH